MEPQNRNIQRLNFSTFLAAASLEFVARPDEHAHHFLAGFGPIRERRGRLPGDDVGGGHDHRVTGPPPPMRALRATNRPSHGARREKCP